MPELGHSGGGVLVWRNKCVTLENFPGEDVVYVLSQCADGRAFHVPVSSLSPSDAIRVRQAVQSDCAGIPPHMLAVVKESAMRAAVIAERRAY